jgi:hypothetical protein
MSAAAYIEFLELMVVVGQLRQHEVAAILRERWETPELAELERKSESVNVIAITISIEEAATVLAEETRALRTKLAELALARAVPAAVGQISMPLWRVHRWQSDPTFRAGNIRRPDSLAIFRYLARGGGASSIANAVGQQLAIVAYDTDFQDGTEVGIYTMDSLMVGEDGGYTAACTRLRNTTIATVVVGDEPFPSIVTVEAAATAAAINPAAPSAGHLGAVESLLARTELRCHEARDLWLLGRGQAADQMLTGVWHVHAGVDERNGQEWSYPLNLFEAPGSGALTGSGTARTSFTITGKRIGATVDLEQVYDNGAGNACTFTLDPSGHRMDGPWRSKDGVTLTRSTLTREQPTAGDSDSAAWAVEEPRVRHHGDDTNRDVMAIYAHAKAMHLNAQRDENIRCIRALLWRLHQLQPDLAGLELLLREYTEKEAELSREEYVYRPQVPNLSVCFHNHLDAEVEAFWWRDLGGPGETKRRLCDITPGQHFAIKTRSGDMFTVELAGTGERVATALIYKFTAEIFRHNASLGGKALQQHCYICATPAEAEQKKSEKEFEVIWEHLMGGPDFVR